MSLAMNANWLAKVAWLSQWSGHCARFTEGLRRAR